MSTEVVIALITLGLALMGQTCYVAVRFGRLEVKVDTIWDHIIRRALVEGLNKGVVTMNSPILVTDEARKWYAGMVEELKAFYKAKGTKLSERDLYVAMEREFGARITKEICIPYNVHNTSCLMAAIELAREGYEMPNGAGTKSAIIS